MNGLSQISRDGRTLTVHIPFSIRTRGGRKLVITPDCSDWRPNRPRIDNAMVKALGRAFRWRKLIETGVHSTIEDLAKSEKINPSYVSRVLRLTLLAPDIVTAILNGRQSPDLYLEMLLRPIPVEWDEQRMAFAGAHEHKSQSS